MRPKVCHIGNGDLLALTGATVPQLDDAIGSIATDDDDLRDTDQFGVAEFHTGRHLGAVVVQHVATGGLDVCGNLLRDLEDQRVAAGGDHVHVERSDGLGPDQALLVVVKLGDDRQDARDTDAV